MPLKEQRPWYENALLLTIAGSIIVVVGQLAGTIIPIMYGPADISDFSISANPAYIEINQSELSQGKYHSWDYNWVHADVRIDDFHPYLRPYRYYVYLYVLKKPVGVDLIFFANNEIKAGGSTTLSLGIDKNKTIIYEPVKIQGIGEDGKMHNMTIYLTAYQYIM